MKKQRRNFRTFGQKQADQEKFMDKLTKAGWHRGWSEVMYRLVPPNQPVSYR